MNQIRPDRTRYSSNGARNALLTGNATTALITCDLDPKWRKERKYERLFFLDEPTALAAGHRPCNRCRRSKLNDFRTAWKSAGLGDGTTGNVDSTIKQQLGKTHEMVARQIPDGTIVRHDEEFQLVYESHLHTWTPSGYTDRSPLPEGSLCVVTPGCIVETLSAGYSPEASHG